jgi:hypothetical protein
MHVLCLLTHLLKYALSSLEFFFFKLHLKVLYFLSVLKIEQQNLNQTVR